MANKKTVVQMYEELLEVPTLTEEQKEFLRKRIEIAKKKNANRSAEPTPKQKEKMEQDAKLRALITEAMVVGVEYTPSDLVKLVDSTEISTPQKMTPLLSTLVTEGVLTRASAKGRSVYSLSADSADEE